MSLRYLPGLSLLLAATAQAATPVPVYHYGMPVDVARVLQLSEPASDTCEVVLASMVYVDSAGRQHSLQYLKLARVCTDRG
ncbi:DUF2790 domain-containing protein [Pseudomonas sp. NPDC087612]|uniref:DUF2790 domain-containing protein n=1 Tax=unclassified Pseudomonas TaxID=196821 RepID=UPI0005EAF9F1|nr:MULTISPECIES: DUF2790 domain-containing protein [unclassified Pseudomonas]KJK18836.1 hypothetical protein UB48_03385 [Pseudomonas sp. 2(2015)]QPG62453.1 DUF2790 domain-containing protein [Pseudomonas sp. BIGb0427]QVM98802.1 DUF2790 domain-containing protein [Pseudomonas sp. SORT22]UVL54319.1 DUF2790 domain-containing protein [Pseudomonas sp. B21-035]UVL59612.1 DUF2790 domain-containing protein [Pseudomonas sp. B21-032]